MDIPVDPNAQEALIRNLPLEELKRQGDAIRRADANRNVVPEEEFEEYRPLFMTNEHRPAQLQEEPDTVNPLLQRLNTTFYRRFNMFHPIVVLETGTKKVKFIIPPVLGSISTPTSLISQGAEAMDRMINGIRQTQNGIVNSNVLPESVTALRLLAQRAYDTNAKTATDDQVQRLVELVTDGDPTLSKEIKAKPVTSQLDWDDM